MDYKRFLSSFEGRSNRARYWLATLVILCAMIFALLSLAAICVGFGIPTGPLNINIVGISASIQLNGDQVASRAGLLPQFVTTLLTPVFAWFYAAASIRRLHDRDKSGWWIVAIVAPTGLYGQFGDWLGGSWAAAFVGLATFIVFMWGVAEMYFLKGSHGSNRFGPDSLASLDTRPRWDQQSELEFVPYSAGPSPGAHVKRGA